MDLDKTLGIGNKFQEAVDFIRNDTMDPALTNDRSTVTKGIVFVNFTKVTVLINCTLKCMTSNAGTTKMSKKNLYVQCRYI